MKTTFLIFFAFASSMLGAITERYVSSASVDTTWADSTSISTPVTLATAITNAVAGDRVNILAGTYSRTTTVDTFGTAGTSTSPIIWRGYSSTIGDGNLGRLTTGALNASNFPFISYTGTGKFWNTAAFNIFESLQIQTAFSGSGVEINTHSIFNDCKIDNSSTNAVAVALGIATGGDELIYNCDVSLSATSGGTAVVQTSSSTNAKVIANRIWTGAAGSGTPPGIQISSGNSHIVLNTIYGCRGNGISVTNTGGGTTILYNTIVGNTGDGINIVSAATNLVISIGNMLTDNGGFGINTPTTTPGYFTARNRYRNNTGGNFSTSDWFTATNYFALTSGTTDNDYVAGASSNDYRLLSTSVAKAAGQPAYHDIGALQRRESQGGFFLP